VQTLSDLKDVQLGAQVGTTSLDFINETVQPDAEPKVYDTTNDAKSALESGQIDAFVTDLVTTVYLRDFEIKNTEVVGKYPRNEQFGMLFEQGNPLVGCVNQVLGQMKEDGTLRQLEEEHLQQYLSVPTLRE
jgi:polar amino acid transport system substrate-binding protein